MTNYEKYKDELIELLAVNGGACGGVFRLRTNGITYPVCSSYTACKNCEARNKQWLNEEAKELDPVALKAGDKIIMRKNGDTDFFTYEVVCNSFPAIWLRFRASENGVQQARDENFLISYDDLLEKCAIKEVLKNEW